MHPSGLAPIEKRCGCGRVFDRAAWDALPFVGRQVIEADEVEPELVIELRNCGCNSTLAIELVTIP